MTNDSEPPPSPFQHNYLWQCGNHSVIFYWGAAASFISSSLSLSVGLELFNLSKSQTFNHMMFFNLLHRRGPGSPHLQGRVRKCPEILLPYQWHHHMIAKVGSKLRGKLCAVTSRVTYYNIFIRHLRRSCHRSQANGINLFYTAKSLWPTWS